MKKLSQACAKVESLPSWWEIVQPISPDSGRFRVVRYEEFMAKVNLGKPVLFFRCEFPEEMNVRSATFAEAVEFRQCIFRKHLDATDARFKKKLSVCQCILKQSITLESARINGVLDLRGSRILLPNGGDKFAPVDTGAYLPPPQFRSAKLAGLQVNGDLKADRLKVHGSLDLGHAEIKGEASFKGVKIGLGKFGGRFYIRQAIVDGDFELEPAVDDDPSSPQAQRTTIFGSLSIGASILMGRLNIRGIDLRGCLHAITAHVKGRILGDCWKHPTASEGVVHPTCIGTHTSREHIPISVFFQDATIDEAVWLHGLITKGAVDFENAKIGGSLELDMWPRDRRKGERKTFQTRLKANLALESLVLKNARISANVRLDGAWLEGRISGHNAHIGAAFLCRPRRYLITEDGKEISTLTRAEIGCNDMGKSISLYGAEIGSNLVISGARLTGGLRMRYAKIGGAVIGQTWEKEDDLGADDLPSQSSSLPTEIGATKEGTSKEGPQSLYLYGAHIGGNLCFESATMAGYLSAELAHIKGSVMLANSKLCTESGENRDHSRVGLFLDKARVDNDVTFINGKCKGGLNAIGCHILGDFMLAEGDGKMPAHIDGSIDLSGAEITGDVLLKGVYTPIHIADATVGKLGMDVGAGRQGKSVDLRGLKFHELDVTQAAGGSAASAHPFIPDDTDPDARPRTMRQILRSKRLLILLGAAVLGLMLILFTPKEWGFYSQMAAGMKGLILTAVLIVGLLRLREWFRSRARSKPAGRNGNTYVELLNLLPRFDLATYSNIECWLANQGDPSEADVVHYAMRRRELLLDWLHLPFERWLWKSLYFVMAGSGTKVHRLLYTHLLVFLVSWLCIFSNPGSVEHPATFVIPSFKITEKSANMAESIGKEPGWHESRVYAWADHNGSPNGVPWGPSEAEKTSQVRKIQDSIRKKNSEDSSEVDDSAWGPADGLWVALNVQIPLIHLWARDEWEPASQTGYWGCWFGVWQLPWSMQYETLAGLIQAFSYLTIPMVIAAGSRMVKRREPL